jgi:outer membrane protein OmpA-like peptidoglycan-associated protein
MNSTTLVYLVFAVWSLICWNWYVCQIKGVCSPGDRGVALTGEPLRPTLPIDTIKLTDILPPTVTRAPIQYEYATPEEERVQIVQFEDHIEIHFPYKSARKEEDEAVDVYLTHLAAELRQTNHTVLLEGHADFVGGAKYNRSLGERRSEAIGAILQRKGVPADQIIVRSFGDTRPQATNDTPEGRYLNRRVEIRTLTE